MSNKTLMFLIRNMKLCNSGIRLKSAENSYVKYLERCSYNFSTNKAIMDDTKEAFSISNYDIIGFDLDNTLLRYNLPEMIELEYCVAAEFLVKEKGYPKSLLEPVAKDLDFLQKGLFLDVDRGNILQVGVGGYIKKATHGTRFLSDNEIVQIYGKERNWDVLTQFVNNPLATWNGPLSEKIRSLLDYFDMPASLVFGRAVDSVDESRKESLQKYDIWKDILAAITHLYKRENFDGASSYFRAMKEQPERYVMKTSPKVVEWLKELKKTKAIYLLTGSNIDFANLVATQALGENWMDLFDVVVGFARKPGFFTDNRSFMAVENLNESNAITNKDLKLERTYSQGNWKDLECLLKSKLTKNNDKQSLYVPRSLYIGDNIIQDVYTPVKHTACDTISVIEEMLEESSNEVESHEFQHIIKSNCWGSYFGSLAQPSIWTHLIKTYSKICIPTVDYLAQNPIQHKYESFNGNSNRSDPMGFYPAQPISVMK